MENNYKIEIISPEKIVFSDEKVHEVILPCYEGEMGILKDHIPIISFLKPGIVKIIKSSENINNFFVEEGIIEFHNNSLIVLSRKIVDIKNLNTHKAEFMDWKWIDIGDITKVAVSFKLDVYKKIQKHLNLIF